MPKRIEELTVADLERSRWCVYHNDEEGYDSFEFVIPDNHPDYSEFAIEVELAHFVFSDGKTFKGRFDGSESFSLYHNSNWYSFWYGISKPSISVVDELEEFLTANQLALPVLVKAAWSGTSRTYNGLQYLDDTGATRELVI
ncbi:hypothetical protein ACROAK_03275 [Shewanella oncorhynchi]|uniref:hypothetical protein n=1 Tax=Shewanella oncorhynchi TaxID=2726434 RepID=UPI003D78FB38